MSDQQDLQQRRVALAQAVNSHDLDAVRSFIHPSYVGKSSRGVPSGYQDIMRLAEQLFAPESDFGETLEIEDIAVSGDKARVTVRRNQEMTGWLWIKSRSTTRAVETWWKVDGGWQLVEEQEL
jgi:ketosteroid isomerase-like protein